MIELDAVTQAVTLGLSARGARLRGGVAAGDARGSPETDSLGRPLGRRRSRRRPSQGSSARTCVCWPASPRTRRAAGSTSCPTVDPAARPVALVTKNAHRGPGPGGRVGGHRPGGAASAGSCGDGPVDCPQSAGGSGVPPATDAASGGEPLVEESDLYGLAQRVADDHRRAGEHRGRPVPPPGLLRHRRGCRRAAHAVHPRSGRTGGASASAAGAGVYDRLRTDNAVVEVPADEEHGWRRRLVVTSNLSVARSSNWPSALGPMSPWARSGSRRASSRSMPRASRCCRGLRRSPPGSSTGLAAPPPRRRCRSSGCSGSVVVASMSRRWLPLLPCPPRRQQQ